MDATRGGARERLEVETAAGRLVEIERDPDGGVVIGPRWRPGATRVAGMAVAAVLAVIGGLAVVLGGPITPGRLAAGAVLALFPIAVAYSVLTRRGTIDRRVVSGIGSARRIVGHGELQSMVQVVVDGGGEESVLRMPARAFGTVAQWLADSSTSGAPGGERHPDAAPILPPTGDGDLAASRPGDHASACRAWHRSQAWDLALRDFGTEAAATLWADLHGASVDGAVAAGAYAEQRVGPVLDSLTGHGWRTLHAVPVDSACHLDHVMVGPGGILVVLSNPCIGEVHAGETRFLVDGVPGDQYLHARHQATVVWEVAAERADAPPPVIPVIALVRASTRAITVEAEPDDVVVTVLADLAERVADLPQVLTPAQVDAWFDVLRAPAAWARDDAA